MEEKKENQYIIEKKVLPIIVKNKTDDRLLSLCFDNKTGQLSQYLIESIGFFIGKSQSKSGDFNAAKKGVPHRLQDDLRWKCSICRSLIATNETHSHLMSCCFDSFLDTLLDDSRSTIMQLDDRPKTKRLERPTPNIRHPVIDAINCDKRHGRSSDLNFFDKIQSKSIICGRNSKRNNNFLRSNLTVPVTRNTKKPCYSCDRPSAPERFHSHHNGDKCNLQKIANDDCNIVISEKCYDPNSSKMKCYLCKKDFGPEEMADHEAECIERWKKENSTSLSTQQVAIRKPSLTSIPGCDPEGWEHFKSQLTPCNKCGRSFFPHRLATHEKVCRGADSSSKSHNSKLYLADSNGRTGRKHLINNSKADKKLSQSSSKSNDAKLNK